jgi:hypothetical protein
MKDKEEIDFNVCSIVWLSRQVPLEKQPEMASQLLRWLEQSGISQRRLTIIKQSVERELLGHRLEPTEAGQIASTGFQAG